MASDLDKPLDTVDELIRQLAVSHASATLICYVTEQNELLTLTGTELERQTRFAAYLYAGHLGQHGGELPSNVALVGQSSLEYYIAFLALQRLGLTTTFISPRLSDQGFEHLLTTTSCGAAVVAERSASTLQRVAARLEPTVTLVPLIDIKTITEALPLLDKLKEISRTQDAEQQSFIIHSSGSTGMPKAVPLHPKSWIRQAQGLSDRVPRIDTLNTLPLFHSFGLATLLRCLAGGRKLSIINAKRPVTAPAILQALDTTLSEGLVLVPYVLKFFVETEDGVARLAKLKQVIAAGSATPDELGNRLVASGVRLFSLYGQTECGGLMEPSSELWNWFTPLPHARPFVKFEPTGDGLFHLVVLPGLHAKVFSNREDGSYETRDLFQQHPERPDLWKFAARYDDIIVLVNGEKADPIPIEHAVGQNPLVRAATAFGAQQESLGLLVIASERAAGMSTEDIVESILPDLAGGNLRVPDYAKIPRDALIVKPAGTEVKCTDKGTVIRPRVLEQFHDDISAYYAAREGSIEPTDAHNDSLDVRESVRHVVRQVLQTDESKATTFADDADFFDLGMDSLQAANVRSRLARKLGLHGLNTNLVFDHPTVNSLFRYLDCLLKGQEDTSASSMQLARELIEKYLHPGFSRPCTPDLVQCGSLEISPDSSAGDRRVVVLTGATGFIGSHILHNLLQNPVITEVHCLVRASDSASAFQRVVESLRRNYVLDRTPTTVLSKILAHACDFAAPDLGLTPALQSRLQKEATHYIHNAWQVNFNLSLRSFETSSIRPTSILLSLASSTALKKKPPFTFVSSIAAVLRSSEGVRGIPETLPHFDAVEEMGYGQSKYVGEQICAAAATRYGIPVRIARVGQVCGDTVHGYWNPSEAVPRTVMTAHTVAALPMIEDGDEQLDWLPVDVVARAVSNVALLDPGQQDGEDLQVFHITNKKRIGWNRHFLPVLSACGLQFDAVPAKQWVKMLEQKHAAATEGNQATQLLAFWTKKYASSTARQTPIFNTTRIATVCPDLGEGFEIGEQLIRKLASHWLQK